MPARDLYRTLWRRRWLIAFMTVLAAVAAYLFSSSQPKVYEAAALVRVQQTLSRDETAFGSVNPLELGQRLAQTYARIVQTRSIRNRVAEALDGVVPLEDISISATPDREVELLTIAARSESPANAAAVANAATASLKTFITETGTLRDQIVVVDRASVPSTPVAPRTMFTVLMVVLLALMLNSALALILESFSDRLPDIEALEEHVALPVLATVPDLSLRSAADAMVRAGNARKSASKQPLDPAPSAISTGYPPRVVRRSARGGIDGQ